MSLTVAPPSATSIAAEDGLHPSAVDNVQLGVITGGVLSNVHVTVLDAEAVLPHASVALNVLVSERAQPDDPTDPSLAVAVNSPLQSSLAVAPPNATSIVAEDGLHPSAVDNVHEGVITGGVISNVQVTVRDADAVLPHASVALNVLVSERAQPDEPTDPS